MRRQVHQINPPDTILTDEKKIIVRTTQQLFHVQVESLQCLTRSEMEVILKKIKRNRKDENMSPFEFVQKQLSSSLPHVIIFSYGILYHGQSGIAAFRISQHLKIGNISTIIKLAKLLSKRKDLYEEEKKVLAISRGFMAGKTDLESL